MTSVMQKWSERFPDFGTVIKRFPVTVLVMACVTLYYILIGWDSRNESINFGIIGLALSAYLAVMQTLWAEARGKKPNWILQIVMAVLITALFYHSKNLHIYIGMIIAAVLLLIGNSVRFGRGRDDFNVWDFTHKIWSAAAFTTLGSIIYLIGVMSILFALKSLFGLNIENLVERLLLPVGFAFLAPLYWLSNVPPIDEPYDYLQSEPSFVSKAVAFMGAWILAPLTLIYALILLAYGVKILAQMSLPDGEIAWLTLPFLIIGTLTWLLLEPPFIQKNGLARLFRKLWFVLCVPAALMLTISVFVRVSEYGLTVVRVLLVLACVWSLGIAAWFIFAPKLRRDIRIIPGFAAALFLIAAPLSYHASIGSQAARFERSLQAMKTASEDDLKPAANAKGALDYLWRHDGKDKARRVMTKAGYEVSDKTKLADVYDILNLKTVTTPRRYSHSDVVVRKKTYEYKGKFKAVSVSGYNYLFGDYYYSLNKKTKRRILELNGANIMQHDGDFFIMEGKKELGRFEIDKWVKSLELSGDRVLGAQEAQILYQDESRELIIKAHQMKLTITNGDKDKMTGRARFYILAKGFEPK